jgi:hypothetical protein
MAHAVSQPVLVVIYRNAGTLNTGFTESFIRSDLQKLFVIHMLKIRKYIECGVPG